MTSIQKWVSGCNVFSSLCAWDGKVNSSKVQLLYYYYYYWFTCIIIIIEWVTSFYRHTTISSLVALVTPPTFDIQWVGVSLSLSLFTRQKNLFIKGTCHKCLFVRKEPLRILCGCSTRTLFSDYIVCISTQRCNMHALYYHSAGISCCCKCAWVSVSLFLSLYVG